MAQKTAEIDDAVQVAANICDAQIPRPGQRHRRNRWDGDHLAGVREPDQPLAAGARESQTRLLDLGGGLRRQARRKLLLERAKIELSGASHQNSLAERRDFREQLIAVDRLDDVVAGALPHTPDLVRFLAL